MKNNCKRFEIHLEQRNWISTFADPNRARGEIGRHATLRGWCLRVWKFESSRAHNQLWFHFKNEIGAFLIKGILVSNFLFTFSA